MLNLSALGTPTYPGNSIRSSTIWKRQNLGVQELYELFIMDEALVFYFAFRRIFNITVPITVDSYVDISEERYLTDLELCHLIL